MSTLGRHRATDHARCASCDTSAKSGAFGAAPPAVLYTRHRGYRSPMTESRAGLRAEAAAFGTVLRGYRRAAGFTQEALAARAGQSRRGLQHLEAGDALPHPAT